MDEIEREINLKHLLYTLCKKWKQIIICALIGAIIFGAYGYYKEKTSISHINKGDLSNKEEILAKQQDYLNNSILMRYADLDIRQRTLQIDIVLNSGNSNQIMKIFEIYSSAIQSKDFLDILASELGEESSDYIYELVSVSNINSDGNIYILHEDKYGNHTLSFMVTLSGIDDAYTADMAKILEKYIEKQTSAINSSICQHNIHIFNLRSATIGNKTTKRTQIEKSNKALEKEIVTLKGGKYTSYKKWILIGLFIGAFAIIGLYTLLYALSDKLHEADEIESLFGIKTWSTKEIQKEKLKEILKATVLANKDNYSIVLATGTAISDNSKNSIVLINQELKKDIFILQSDIISNPEAIKALSQADAVLLMETLEKSKMTDIYREIKYIKQSNVPIIGCMVE